MENMRNLRTLGVALVVVFACSAFVAAAASASSFAPEFATCVKAPKVNKKYTGKFGNKSCTEAATEGKYELASAVGAEFTGKSKATTLHATSAAGNAEVIVCKKDKSKGVVAGESRVTATITYEGCANEKKEPCGTGGKIESESGFGILLAYLNEAQTEDGAFSASPMAPFSCGSERFELQGLLDGTVSANGKDVTISYAVNGAGEQGNRFLFSEGEPSLGPDYLYTEHAGEHEATVAGSEELKLKGVYIIS